MSFFVNLFNFRESTNEEEEVPPPTPSTALDEVEASIPSSSTVVKKPKGGAESEPLGSNENGDTGRVVDHLAKYLDASKTYTVLTEKDHDEEGVQGSLAKIEPNSCIAVTGRHGNDGPSIPSGSITITGFGSTKTNPPVTFNEEIGIQGSLAKAGGSASTPGTPRKSDDNPKPSSGPTSAIGFTSYNPGSIKTNRQMISNAVQRSIFPGPPPGLAIRGEILKALDSAAPTFKHFVILFRSAEPYHYRGLYGFNCDTGKLQKVHGQGPSSIPNDEAIDQFLKYNSGSRVFEIVGTKHLSITIDGITLPNGYWLGKKAGPASKVKQNKLF